MRLDSSTGLLGLYISVFPVMLAIVMLRPWLSVFGLHLGADYVTIGYIGAASSISGLLGSTIGYISDKVGKKALFLLGLVLNLSASLLLILAYDSAQIIPIAFIFGLSSVLLIVTSEAMGVEMVSPQRRLEVIGRINFFLALSGGVGPFVGGLIIQQFHFVPFFLCIFAIAGVSAIISPIKLFRNNDTKVEQTKGTRSGHLLGQIWPFAVAAFAFGATYSMVTNIFPADLQIRGTTTVGVGFLIASFGFVRASITWLTGYLSRLGQQRLLVVGTAIMAVTLPLLGILRGFFFLLGILIVLAVGMGLVLPTAIASATTMVPSSRIGSAVGTIEMVFGIGGTVAAFLAGVMAERLGVSSTYIAMGSLSAIASVVVKFSKRE